MKVEAHARMEKQRKQRADLFESWGKQRVLAKQKHDLVEVQNGLSLPGGGEIPTEGKV